MLNVPVSFFKTVLLIFSLFSSGTLLRAQTITVSGCVKDVKGYPVEGASVRVSPGKVALTDLTGKYRLAGIAPGALITCSAIGIKSATKKGPITSRNDSVVINFVVKRLAGSELETVTVGALGLRTSSRSHGYATSSPSPSAVAPTRIDKGISGKISGLVIAKSVGEPALVSRDGRAAEYYDKTTMPESEGKFKRADKSPPDDSYKSARARSRSRMLTAGEVNDFTKWTLWEDYAKNEFVLHSSKWELYADTRYSVQLQNKERRPLIGKKVFLMDNSTHDTLWTAVTDNTGKAELWENFLKKNKQGALKIRVENAPADYEAIRFAQGINRIVLDRLCNVPQKVEIAFLVDATGSMGDEIAYLKEELEDVLSAVAKKDSTLQLRTGAVFYRDQSDEYVTKVQQFSDGNAATGAFIRAQNAAGGGDFPEALNTGLADAVNTLQWSESARTRILFILMDAPPHDAGKTEMQQLIVQAAAKGIRVVPIACSGTDKATEFIMRSIALATNGTYLFLTDDSGIGAPHIKPTTDEFKVELLNDLLHRTIEQMCFANNCENVKPLDAPIALFTNREQVKVFPNPTQGPLRISSSKELRELFVTDFAGKILMRVVVRAKGDYVLDLSAYPSGTYFIKYFTKEGTGGAEKVIVLR